MKTIKHFNPIVAEKKGLPLATIQAVNEWFWREGIKRNLSEANHRSIFVTGIGTITISRYKLNKEILSIIQRIRRIAASDVRGKESRVIKLRATLSALCKRRNEIATDYKQAFGIKVRIRPLTIEDYLKDQS